MRWDDSKSIIEFPIQEFLDSYGKKAGKILNKEEEDLFMEYNMSSNNELDIIEDDEDDADLIDASEADIEKKPLRKVVYDERVLKITFNKSKQSVSCDYCIKLPNGNNKLGKFNMKHSNNGYEELEEKVNPD